MLPDPDTANSFLYPRHQMGKEKQLRRQIEKKQHFFPSRWHHRKASYKKIATETTGFATSCLTER